MSQLNNRKEVTTENALAIEKDIHVLRSIGYWRIESRCANRLLNFDSFADNSSHYASFVKKHNLSQEERILLILTLVPHIIPDFFDQFLSNPLGLLVTDPKHKRYYQIPGIINNNTGFTFPSGLTFLFFTADSSISDKMQMISLLNNETVFAKEKVISLEPHQKGEVSLSGRLVMAERWIEYFLLGHQAHKNSIKYWSIT
jgi:hypothetical protein